MKVFISQPMHDKSEEEIKAIKEQAKEEIKKLYQFFANNNQLEIISTTEQRKHELLPREASRLWWLGRAIQMLEDVDVIYMCNGWEESKGCRIERSVAIEYNISIHYQGEKRKRDTTSQV